jgi:hypothetical protein
MGCCEYGDELLGSMKCREFFDQLRFYWVLKKDSVSWSYLVGWLDRHSVSLFIREWKFLSAR